MILDRLWVPLVARWHKEGFLIRKVSDARVLDVGCGNNGVHKIRRYCKKGGKNVYYSGLDVGDYNFSDASKEAADEYVIVPPPEFAGALLRWEMMEDAVISSHNLEHCDEPATVIDNIVRTLKSGGWLYLSFPSEESADFPKGFEGCLNFYDDLSHQHMPSWDDTIERLKADGMEIIHACRNYRPLLLRMLGFITWPIAKRRKRVTYGTWEYFGFESVIWARKK